MIFELKNKIPRNSSFLRSEDVLTSTVFGNLRYFRDQSILIAFLNESTCLNGDKLNLKNNNSFSIGFWEKHYNDTFRRYNETDIILNNNKYTIIIECKYRSPLGEEEIENGKEIDYSNQLIRYSKILLNKKYENQNKIVIFLTDERTMPKDILLKSRKGINEHIELYWLSWNKLYLALMEQDRNNFLQNELLLYNDLVEFLFKRNIITFEKFCIADVVCNFHYKKKYQFAIIDCGCKWHYKKCYNYTNEKVEFTWRYKK